MKPRTRDIPIPLDRLPSVLAKLAAKLCSTADQNLTEGELIQRRLLTDLRMKEVWPKVTTELPTEKKGLVRKIIFKLPKLILEGRNLELTEPQLILLERLIKADEKTIALSKMLTGLGFKKSCLQRIQSIRLTINQRIESMVATDNDSFYREFGRDYIRAWDFRKKKGTAAVELFAIRITYLLFRECGIEKMLAHQIGIVVTVALGLEKNRDIDQDRVRKMIQNLRGSLGFQRQRRSLPKNAFCKI